MIPTIDLYLLLCLRFVTVSNTKRLLMDYPYVVSVKHEEKSQHLCSGSLLDLKWVVTSAKVAEKYELNPWALIVSRANQTRAVERIYHDRGYNSRTLKHDISLFLLREPFVKTIFVDVCRIPVFPMDIEMIVKCEEVEVIGFSDSLLNSSTYRVIPNEDCKKIVHYDPSKVSFCAAPENAESCVIDNGGPAICEGFVFGVTSYGCSPGVFTRIDKHLKFIVKTVGRSSLLRAPTEEQMQRNREHFIIAVSSSVFVLLCVVIILICSLGVSEKLKCCRTPR